MPLTLENSNRTWERVKAYLANGSPAAQHIFKELKMWLATQKGNPDLAILPLTPTGTVGAGGQVLAAFPATVYAVYSRKANTAVDSYLGLFDDAADDSGAGTDGRVIMPLLAGNDEAIYISPFGIPMAAGVVAKAYTDFDGVTDSAAADAGSGFVIVGAA